MFRAPAAAIQARLRIPAPVLVPALLLGLAVSLTGCGADQIDETPAGPSKQAVECRKEWNALEQDVDGRDSASTPSALASRWNTVAATIDYYATSASDDDCGQTLAAQESAIEALAGFSKRLARYDMELRLEQVKAEAEAYAAGPRPPAPKPRATKGKKQGKNQAKGTQKAAPRPPKPSDIAAALKTVTAQAPRASQQQLPAWQQARVTELSEKTAVKKAIKDLAFLSRESKAYRTCTAALVQIMEALSAKSG